MRYKVEFFLEPVEKDEVPEMRKIIETYGIKVSEVVTNRKHKEICIAGSVSMEKIVMLHLKHRAIALDVSKPKCISKWWGKGVFVEYNPVFK